MGVRRWGTRYKVCIPSHTHFLEFPKNRIMSDAISSTLIMYRLKRADR